MNEKKHGIGHNIRQAVLVTVVLLVLCGLVFPVLLSGLSAVIFPSQAKGSLVTADGIAVGAKNVGQDFTEDYFMWCRPSAYNYNTYYEEDTDGDGQVEQYYNDGSEFAGLSSGSNNYAPSNPALTERVEADIEEFLEKNPGVSREDIPTDLMTASGSGLDPHISPSNHGPRMPSWAEDTGMQFHFEKMLEKRYEPQVTVTNETPAWLMICLAESIKDWIGQSPRIFCKSEEPYLQFGYEVLTFPVAEFAQIFGPLIYAINQAWPVQVFGMGSQDELVELSFTKEGTAPTIQQKNVSGIPCAELRDLYFCVKFPDPLAADCMFRLLDAVEKKSAAVALEWEYADFLEQQRLARIDRTLSYCYVSLEEEESADPVGWLSGLTLQQKCELWRMFLGKRLFLPEFEWLRDAMLQGAVPNWIEWHLALYRVLEEENIRFFCKDGQFELLDKEGHRIYFGVDHSEAAEQVLMKVLFPLNQ